MSIKSMNQEWPNRWSNCENLDVDIVINVQGDEPFMLNTEKLIWSF
jgi:CMP-2-keto-3-deoxyoctulosonic acid synthetase